MYLTKSLINNKFKDAGKVIIIQDEKVVEITIQNLWNLIDNYADSLATHRCAEEVSYGKVAIDAEVEYKKTRADIRGFLGLPPESE